MRRPLKRPTRGRPGFSLVEILIVLGLLAVFALIAGLLFRVSLRTTATTGRAIEAGQRFDLLLSELRADLWQAERIEADGPTATLGLPGGAAVVWTAQPDGTVAREEQPAEGREAKAGPLRRWERVGHDIRFEAAGPALRVSVAATEAATNAKTAETPSERDEATLVSQLLLAGRHQQ